MEARDRKTGRYVRLDGSKFRYGSGWKSGRFDVMGIRDLKERYCYLEVLGFTYASWFSPNSDHYTHTGMNVAINSEEELAFLSRRLARDDSFDYRKDPNNTSVDFYFRPRKKDEPRDLRFDWDRARIRNPNFSYYHENLLPALGSEEEKHLLCGLFPICAIRIHSERAPDETRVIFKTSSKMVYDNLGLILENQNVPYFPSYRQIYRGRGSKTKKCDIFSFLFYEPSRIRRFVDGNEFPSAYSSLCRMRDMGKEEAFDYIRAIERAKIFERAKIEGRFGRTNYEELREVISFCHREISSVERELGELESDRQMSIDSPDAGQRRRELEKLKRYRDECCDMLDDAEEKLGRISRRRARKSFGGRRSYERRILENMRAQEKYEESKKA
ncbi:MAG: hypothetical protein QXU82_02905 [Candidatus Aenigmatarchaeota archaeon]